MRHSQKEDYISKSKIQTASASFKACMAAPAGGGADDIMKVVEGLKKANEEQAEVVEEEAEALKDERDRESVVEQVEQRRIKSKENELKSNVPAKWKIMVATILAIIIDISNIPTAIAALFTGGGSLAADAGGDIVWNIIFATLLGKHYMKSRPSIPIIGNILAKVPIPATLWEFVPIIDLWPSYYSSVKQTKQRIAGDIKEINELEKEKKMLKGGSTGGKAGFLGFNGTGWLIISVIMMVSAGAGFFLGGLIGVIAVPAIVFLGILFFNPETKSTAITIFFILLLGGGVFAFVILIAGSLAGSVGGPLGNLIDGVAGLGTGLGTYWETNNPIDRMRNYVKKQMLVATGDYYTGKVDENAQAKLGVFLEDLKQADPVFYVDRPITMFATLTVLTLDEPVNVTIGCKDDSTIGGAVPTIVPKEHFVVDTYEEQEIDCMFEKGAIEKGSSRFTLSADFNFKTMSYVKSYFMDQERLRSMRRDEIDPLDQYGIKDKNPSAIYTNGPVGIGMGIGKPPVGIDSNEPYETMTLGITLENKWEGKIIKVRRFVVLLPKGFVLEEIGVPYIQATCDDLRDEEKSLCSSDLNNVYIVSDPGFVEVDRGNFKSYRAFLRVDKSDYEKVVGKLSPISTQYFKTIIDYTYRLEKIKTIDVKTRSLVGFGGDELVAGSSADTTKPAVESVDVERINETAVKIKWKTSEPSVDIFEWWEASKAPPVYPAQATSNDIEDSEDHERTLIGVSAGKGYGYKITSIDKAGNSAETTRTFTG